MTDPKPRPSLVVILGGGFLALLFGGVLFAAATSGPSKSTVATEPAVPVGEQVRALWTEYDRLPAEQRTKDALARVIKRGNALTEQAPASERDILIEAHRAAARSASARFLNPRTHSAGERDATLVPSDDLAECLVWGSQWSKGETAESLRGMGFTSVACANGRRWAL